MKKITLIALMFFMFIGFGQVSAQKIAHINVDELIVLIPEKKSIDDQLQGMQQRHKLEIDKMSKEFDALIKKYQAEAKTKSVEENQKREQEVQNRQKSIQEYIKTASDDIAKKSAELSKPISDKMNKAIGDVATEKGIDYVFDSSKNGGNLLYAKGTDILIEVKEKMGIKP